MAKTRVVLMSPPKPDAATKTNAGLLAEHFDGKRIFQLPWLGGNLIWRAGRRICGRKRHLESWCRSFEFFCKKSLHFSRRRVVI